MALTRINEYDDGAVSSGPALEQDLDNIYNNPIDLWSPAAKAADFNGFEVIMDADADSSLTADTDDRLDVRLQGVDLFYLDGTTSTIANLHMRGTAGGFNSRISDVNGNEIVRLQGVASAVNQIDITNAATGVNPEITVQGDANVGLDITAAGTGSIRFNNGTDPVDLRFLGAAGGYNNRITDLDGNEIVRFRGVASAASQVDFSNGTAANGPVIEASGDAAATPLNLLATSTAPITLNNGTDPVDLRFLGAAGGYNNRISDVNGNEILELQGVASAVNQVAVVNAATTARPRLDARGETNVSFALRPSGTGQIIQENNAGNDIGWVPRGYYAGCVISRASATTLSISVGLWRDSTDATNIRLTAAITKSTSAWAVGSGNGGGLDGALGASATWYNVFLLLRSDTGVVDVGFDTGATPTFPTGYDFFRLIGSWRTDATPNFVSIVQYGEEFLFVTTIEDVDATPNSAAAQTATLTVPTGRQVWVRFRGMVGDSTTVGTGVIFTSPDESDQAPASFAAPSSSLLTIATATETTGQFEIRASTLGQIRYRATAADVDMRVSIHTYGWRENFREN